MASYWIGADPGGIGKFGLAFLDNGKLCCNTVSSVDEAVAEILKMGEPLGLGIDAPMWWSSVAGGGRKSDSMLREQYGIHSGTVQSANSLRGSALVGGTLLALIVRQQFPDARITESHPKALLKALGLTRKQFPKQFGISSGWSGNEDEQDAAIAAVCAREGFGGCWKTDLASAKSHCQKVPSSIGTKSKGSLALSAGADVLLLARRSYLRDDGGPRKRHQQDEG